ncbi:hypothetical protein Lal_00033258 [Lupinus albus]|nr:hypothetical protein Lal_00033258 [Lupinus albus]
MAEEVEPSPLTQSHTISPPHYVEVKCTSSGNSRRFAAGTDAGFAVSLINRKLKKTMMVVSHIEAVKDGEEPIAFGPNSVLINFGNGWMLQTVTDSGNPMQLDGAEMWSDAIALQSDVATSLLFSVTLQLWCNVIAAS